MGTTHGYHHYFGAGRQFFGEQSETARRTSSACQTLRFGSGMRAVARRAQAALRCGSRERARGVPSDGDTAGEISAGGELESWDMGADAQYTRGGESTGESQGQPGRLDGRDRWRSSSWPRARRTTWAAAITTAIVTVGALLAIPACASAAGGELSFASPFTAPTASPASADAGAIAVLTSQGLSPARAGEALAVQNAVARTQFVSKVEGATARAFAGAWFENAAAQLHIGAASPSTRRSDEELVAREGLTGEVTVTPVRSTMAVLVAVQERWNDRLAKLMARGEAMTGLDLPRNAVSVTVSSAVPASERATIKREAANPSVTVLASVAPPDEVRIAPKAVTCEKKFKTKKAYCEKTITSGVGIVIKVKNKGKGKSHKTMTLDGFAEAALSTVEINDKVEGPGIEAGTTVTAKPTKTSVTISKAATKEEEAEFTFSREPRCTAGPMLIKGYETYLLTAGHCFNEVNNANAKAVTTEVTSEYPAGGGQKEIGKEVTQYEEAERDFAEVRINPPPSTFTEALPLPVDALMAEWEKSPETPHSVDGVRAKAAEVTMPGQMVCHEGTTSGERCGEVKAINVAGGPLPTKHLVEQTSCSLGGDSGGPYFFRTETGEVLMMGIEKGGPGDCLNAEKVKPEAEECVQPCKNYFSPLLDVAGGAGDGILSTFKGQKLLTTANEARKVRIRGPKGGVLVKSKFTITSGAGTFEAKGGAQVACTADSGTGEDLGAGSGSAKVAFTGCAGFGGKCHTVGAAEGEIALSADWVLEFTNGVKDEVGLLLELTEATIECGKNCEGKVVEKLKLRGTGIGLATPIDEEVIPASKFTITFAQVKGAQSLTEYEEEKGGKVKAILEMEGSGEKVFAFEQAGLANTEQLLFEEAAEFEG